MKLIKIALLMIVCLVSACSANPGSRTVEAANQRAESLLAAAQYNDAALTLIAAQKKASFRESADFYHLLALAYYGKEEYSKAVVSYRQALNLAPERTDILNNLGLAYLARHEYQQAIAEFSRALTDLNYSKPHLLYYNLALCYQRTGNFSDSLMNLERALELAPQLSQAYQLRGQIYLQQKKYKDAVLNLENATRLEPRDAEGFLFLAEAYRAQGHKTKAQEAYRRVMSIAPGTPLALEAAKKMP